MMGVAKLVQCKWPRYMVRAACNYDGCSQVSAVQVAKIHGEGKHVIMMGVAKLVQCKWPRYMVRAACNYDGCSQVSAVQVAKIHGEGSM